MFISDIFEVVKNDSYILGMVLVAIFIFLASILRYTYLVHGLKKFGKILMNSLEGEETTVESRLVQIDGNFKGSKNIQRDIKQSWNRFFTEYNSKSGEIIPDTYDFFTENLIVNKAGFRKVVEIVPAVFVSLGLLGTFWGITTGISGIDTQSGAEGLQQGINGLLGGMSFAFYSSIAGIVISLLYQLVDRLFLHRFLLGSLEDLLYSLDTAIPVKTEASLLDKIVKTQQAQLDDLKTFFADEFISNLTTGISDSISKAMNPHLEKSNAIMETVAKNTLAAQNDSLNEMVNHFIESLNEMTGDHIKDLGEALHKTVEWQEKVHGEMSSLVAELSNVAEKQSEMARNTTDLSEKMNNYTITLSDYQEKLISSTQELNSMTGQNTDLLEQMKELSKEMNNRHEEAEDHLTQKINQMNETLTQFTSLGSSMNDLQGKTNSTIETLTTATDTMNLQVEQNSKLNDSLVSQHELSNEWSMKTQSLLEDLVNKFEINETMQQNAEELYKKIVDERKSLDTMRDEYWELLENNVEGLKQYWEDNKEALINNQEQFATLNNVLSQSMADFADHMQRGVQHTFEHFDKELKTAVQYLDRGVGSIGQVVESMETNIDSVNSQLTRFNQSLDELITKVEV